MIRDAIIRSRCLLLLLLLLSNHHLYSDCSIDTILSESSSYALIHCRRLAFVNPFDPARLAFARVSAAVFSDPSNTHACSLATVSRGAVAVYFFPDRVTTVGRNRVSLQIGGLVLRDTRIRILPFLRSAVPCYGRMCRNRCRCCCCCYQRDFPWFLSDDEKI